MGPKQVLGLEIENYGLYTLTSNLSGKSCHSFETIADLQSTLPDYCRIAEITVVGLAEEFEFMDEIRALCNTRKRLFEVEELCFHDENAMYPIPFHFFKEFVEIFAIPNRTKIAFAMDIGPHRREFLNLIKEGGFFLDHWDTFAENVKDTIDIKEAVLNDKTLKIVNCRLNIRVKEGINSRAELNTVGMSFLTHLLRDQNMSFSGVHIDAWNWRGGNGGVEAYRNSEGWRSTEEDQSGKFHPMLSNPSRGYVATTATAHRSYELQRSHRFPTIRVNFKDTRKIVNYRISAKRKTLVCAMPIRRCFSVGECRLMLEGEEMLLTHVKPSLTITYVDCTRDEEKFIDKTWLRDLFHDQLVEVEHIDENLPFSLHLTE